MDRLTPPLLAFTLYTIAFGLTLSAYPALLSKNTSDDLERSAQYFGAATFIKHFLEFFSTLALGRLSDKIGRRPVFMSALFIVSLETIIVASAPSLFTLLLSKVLAGLGDCCYLMICAIVSDICATSTICPTKGFGFVGAAYSIGFIIGPLLASFIEEIFGARAVFALAGTCTVIALLITFLFLVETSPTMKIDHHNTPTIPNSSAHSTITSINPFLPLYDFLKDKKLRYLAVPFAISFFADGINVIFVLHMRAVLHTSPHNVGYYISTFGVLSVCFNLIIINVIVPNLLSDEYLAMSLMGLESLRLMCCGTCTDYFSFTVVMVIFSGTCMYHTALKSVLYKASKDRPQGSLQGALAGMRTLSLGTGSLFFSTVYSHSVKINTAYSYTSFFVAAFVLAAGSIYTALLFIYPPNYNSDEEDESNVQLLASS